MDELLHDLGDELPEPWAWPARQRADGWWYLRYGSTERPLHRLAFLVNNGGRLDWDCVHCGSPVVFGGTGAEQLQVDHLSGDKNDCRSSNLAASCRSCNRRKGSGRL